jgi:ABC-2 type transport system permease protein
MTALFSSTFSSATYYQDRDSGILRVFFASPHPPRTILLGKMLSAVIVGALQAALILAISAGVPAIDFEWQYGVAGGVGLLVIAIVLLNVFLAGLGQILASRIGTMTGFHLVMNLVLFPFLFFSGAFFPIDDLPLWLKLLGRVNPLSYGVDLMQLALYADGGDGYAGIPVDLAVLVALAVLTFVAGSIRPARSTR